MKINKQRPGLAHLKKQLLIPSIVILQLGSVPLLGYTRFVLTQKIIIQLKLFIRGIKEIEKAYKVKKWNIHGLFFILSTVNTCSV